VNAVHSRVWLRGMGAATPWGGWRDADYALATGRSAIAPITRFDASGFPCNSAAICDFPMAALDPRYTLTLAAWADALIDNDGWRAEFAGARVGIFWGCESGLARFSCAYAIATAIGESAFSIDSLIASDPCLLANIASHYTDSTTPAVALAKAISARGPIATYSYACASGAVAIAEALRAIRQGRCDMALCGGVGADVDPLQLGAFARLGALSRRGVCSPFDTHRDGFVLGEGAALLVLSAIRGDATIELAGAGRSLDAATLTAPRSDGSGAARAISAALSDGNLTAWDVVHVEAHGTGTLLNDQAEVLALRLALGSHANAVSISACKSALGHWLAGAGALGAIAAVAALQRGQAFPIISLIDIDEGCALAGVEGSPQSMRTGDRVALVNSFGFGGANACLAFRQVAS
jgi:3-oxoacyl-(acyl-carrier-protein) synthase